MIRQLKHLISLCLIFVWGQGFAQDLKRKDILLNDNWFTVAEDQKKPGLEGFYRADYDVHSWKKVNVPHNWDQYEGYRRKLHGNKHGYAWYRKTFQHQSVEKGKRYFLYFEGVGSYATIWLNGKKVGQHAGGRTTFTLDITKAILTNNKKNILAVRADHPANIQDLPWVDGGCSPERGFSEGSQPMGIFRPVHLIVTNDLRVEPFGVHIWNDAKVSEKAATLQMETEIRNYSSVKRQVILTNELINKDGMVVDKITKASKIAPGETILLPQSTSALKGVKLWSLEDPYLYTLRTRLIENEKIVDEIKTPYGIRWISWPIGKTVNSKQFLLNGKPVFINGIAEYEHLIGQSHAFSSEQIKSRVMQIKSIGFNAFRDAHQPHNLEYGTYWDQLGILCWTQMAAHIWYDTPEFRNNFKSLLKDWVKERRNSPSVVLWGLENESTLPADFARECTELIRQLDPTASSQRKVTTCNGGEGTDWDVPQNWTGTYGGNPLTYAEDLKRQVLVGEYGAWRTIDLHTEGPFVQNGAFSENNMTQLMETKVRLAETAKNETAGHFFWLFNSHDNPGRTQGGEGLRELDRIGPVNYKGLFTPWEEPLDVFYMFQGNFAPKTSPMVYLVSHTWPNRWVSSGIKDSITVYSNCDEVELFNDVNHLSLGKRTKKGIGSHFQWDGVNVQYNVLYAVGYIDGKEVCKDYIVLNNLPESEHFAELKKGAKNLTVPVKRLKYLYRINCGGPDFQDENGNLWSADRQLTNGNAFGSSSWTSDFEGIPSFFASQRRTFDPIKGSTDWKLFQSFRYGRDKLSFNFPVPDGEYEVSLYFIEPWLGTGGTMNCEGMRLFDVAINDKTVLKDLDIWKESGHDAVLKKVVKTHVKGGKLIVSFPVVKAGQALISAISIATSNEKAVPAEESLSIIKNKNSDGMNNATWMDVGESQYIDDKVSFTSLPSNFYGSEWIQTARKYSDDLAPFTVTSDADVYIGVDASLKTHLPWMIGYEDTKTTIENSDKQVFTVFRKRYDKGSNVQLGANNSKANMYTIVVSPVTNLEPAHDLKVSKSYLATNAALVGKDIVKETLLGKERVTFKSPSGSSLEWTIVVGVADMYSLTVKYRNPFERSLKGRLEFLSYDGTVMNVQQAVFNSTKEGKWNYFAGSSGSMINAGTYKVRLVPEDASGLSVDALDVQ